MVQKQKQKEDGRIFPVTDKSKDVAEALISELNKYGDKLKLNLKTIVKDISEDNGKISVLDSKGNTNIFDKCIIATGGKSYPLTGSTGDRI